MRLFHSSEAVSTGCGCCSFVSDWFGWCARWMSVCFMKENNVRDSTAHHPPDCYFPAVIALAWLWEPSFKGAAKPSTRSWSYSTRYDTRCGPDNYFQVGPGVSTPWHNLGTWTTPPWLFCPPTHFCTLGVCAFCPSGVVLLLFNLRKIQLVVCCSWLGNLHSKFWHCLS